MQFSVLASGSKGNCTYVEKDGRGFLIDAGLSGKKITERLAKIGRSMDQVEGILVTHEHTDHIQGVGVLSRKHHIPIYANEKTWEAMRSSIGNIPSDYEYRFEPEQHLTLASIDIESFNVSHDAVNPMFFSMYANERKLAIMTDTGYVSDRMKGFIRGADSFIFESNHDVGMLQMGSYPWNLKRRILSDVGHVSNEDAAVAMSEVVEEKETAIYLAHLSRDNNMKELARLSVAQTLEACGIRVGEYVRLEDTDPEEPTRLTTV